MKPKNPSLHKSTEAVHAGGLKDTMYGEVSVPIFQSATFSFSSAEDGAGRFSGEKPGFIYTRMGNPTVSALEEAVCRLEKGFSAIATATGMSAITTVFLTLLDQGSHIVSTASVYGPTRMVLEKDFSRFGIASTFVDTSDLANIARALRPETRLVFIETPANPTMSVSDIRGAADIAHRHGALLVVDNTFASPYLQRPIEHDADIVIASLTKFMNGHSDVVGGIIVTRTEEVRRKIRSVLNLFGGTMDPHQAWLILRGIQTLSLRMEKAQANAAELAGFLQQHPNVAWVKYPGLPDHPQHDIARKQMDGFGAMIAFGVKKGIEGGLIVMNNVQLFTLAVSLGGVESLIEHPASMTHASVPRAEREASGILDELVRISVGCEHVDDLRTDLNLALNMIA